MKAAHNCPDWDYKKIYPGTLEMDCCRCDFTPPGLRFNVRPDHRMVEQIMGTLTQKPKAFNEPKSTP